MTDIYGYSVGVLGGGAFIPFHEKLDLGEDALVAAEPGPAFL